MMRIMLKFYSIPLCFHINGRFASQFVLYFNSIFPTRGCLTLMKAQDCHNHGSFFQAPCVIKGTRKHVRSCVMTQIKYASVDKYAHLWLIIHSYYQSLVNINAPVWLQLTDGAVKSLISLSYCYSA